MTISNAISVVIVKLTSVTWPGPRLAGWSAQAAEVRQDYQIQL